MEQNIAISIHVPKLLEWLISRRHCKNEWQPEAVKIRAKINAAIQDMPANETIASLLSGTYINYFHCLKIIEILETTEADSKNIFGSYTSKRMKDWKEIVSLYKKNNVYLAEAAELTINIVKYELPNLKKLISKQQQLQNDAKKKETEALKAANTARNELNSFLKELGLDKGEGSYKKRLVANALQLHATHEKVASETKLVLSALEHYINFTALSLPQHTVNLNLIKYIAEKGNTTVYELIHGEVPTQIITPPPVFTEDEPEETNEDTIDWGFDEVNASLEAQPSTIDDAIDLGFEDGTTDNIQEEKLHNKVASGDKALTVFENSQTRTNFINQLLELNSFLKMRLFDARKEGPNDDLVESVAGLEDMSKSIVSVTGLLLSKTSQHFYNILFLPNYLDNLVAKINEKADAIERWTAVAALSKERQAEAAVEAVELSKKAQVIVRKGRELQEEIRKDIAERYNGRTVTLMGGPTFDRH
ncbi:CDK5 regulatory subunit-associated protein 3 isoform X2 [Halyomorpha halys]|uniref:CDK5 regulatory subunit-associated protein 3 isoform X2 n=1 Tax=Halyomorpha halys TaxID=286706 RepID=UPI0006D4D0A7|nr:CDK5 regulatory subunit-associated protein 3 isoform X2 [Halyomorpha halys]